MNIFEDDLSRLSFEDFIWIIFIVLSILNIVGDKCLKDFVKTNNKKDISKADKIFLFTLFVSFLIYIYFLIRNIKAFEKVSKEEKSLYSIKVFGSIFFVVGIVYLMYFQYKQIDFVVTPI